MALVHHFGHDSRDPRRPARPRFEPTKALHSAAAIGACAPLLVIVGTVFLIPEKKAPMNIQGMKHTLEELSGAFRRRHLWIIAAFIFLYYFSPGLSTPLYFVMTDNLKFSQAYIGFFRIPCRMRLDPRCFSLSSAFQKIDA